MFPKVKDPQGKVSSLRKCRQITTTDLTAAIFN